MPQLEMFPRKRPSFHARVRKLLLKSVTRGFEKRKSTYERFGLLKDARGAKLVFLAEREAVGKQLEKLLESELGEKFRLRSAFVPEVKPLLEMKGVGQPLLEVLRASQGDRVAMAVMAAGHEPFAGLLRGFEGLHRFQPELKQRAFQHVGKAINMLGGQKFGDIIRKTSGEDIASILDAVSAKDFYDFITVGGPNAVEAIKILRGNRIRANIIRQGAAALGKAFHQNFSQTMGELEGRVRPGGYLPGFEQYKRYPGRRKRG